MVSTSPGRTALPETMFSAIGTNVLTLIGSPRLAITYVACTTAAAPAMSDFISFMLAAGLMVRPPESNVMPLPTSARWCFAPLGE